MKTTVELKKEALRIKGVNDKAIELGLSKLLKDDSNKQIEEQLNIFSFEIFETDSKGIKVQLIGVYFKETFLGAKIIASNGREFIIHNEDAYKTNKSKF